MRKRLQLALMASPVIATFFFLTTPHVQAQSAPGGGSIVATTDNSGHTVYVNDAVPAQARPRRAAANRRSRLVYWSVTKHRWKPVPSANIRAARSAAEEVDRYLGSSSSGATRTSASNFARASNFTPAEINAAIEQAAARHNVDPNLVRAVIKVESNFNPNAVSRKGAMGLMQLMPATARELNLTNPFDPEQNVDAGVRHLKHLMESFGGDVRLSLAAYNAGAGAVERSAGIPHIAETRNYVRRITALYNSGESSGFPGSPAREPIRVGRDAQGVLYFSNTE
jgi:soluble lytic murein transglycosylase-like protein